MRLPWGVVWVGGGAFRAGEIANAKARDSSLHLVRPGSHSSQRQRSNCGPYGPCMAAWTIGLTLAFT